ncbi:MAG: 3'-5' exonuclease, partial [Pseudoflavonifractor sp.]
SVPAAGRVGDGVRILSIHKSKGLEFPVVILAGLARLMNRDDMRRPILFHPKLGVGPKRLDTARMIEYPTLARSAVARQLEYEMTAEELRLLYVAMTRAQEKLILSCALRRGVRDLQKLAPEADCPADPQVLAGCTSMAQWILLPALCRPEALPLRIAGDVEIQVPAAEFGPVWEMHWVEGAPLREAYRSAADPPLCGPAPAEPVSAEELTTRLLWTYPHRADVEIPSKLTATQLKGRKLDEEIADAAMGAAEIPPRQRALRRPRFAEEALGLTAAQKGTALHLVMQYINFSKTGSKEQVEDEIARLVAQAFLTPQQGQAVAAEKIVAFFAAPLGRKILESPTLRRELKFSMLVPAAEYYPAAGAGEQVLLQGVVDCCFETAQGITVVDFKTDRTTAETQSARAEEYRPQLLAYSRALAEITGKQVCRRVLWFFATDSAVEI